MLGEARIARGTAAREKPPTRFARALARFETGLLRFGRLGFGPYPSPAADLLSNRYQSFDIARRLDSRIS
jgi:hypothetical protein